MDERQQTSLFDDNAEYTAFVEKFKPKKTTDDCYTPAPVYEAVAEWVTQEYGVEPGRFVRPFFPELDFMTFPYPEGGVVVDNPPFSLLSKIIRHYTRIGLRFFLFAPALTLFTATECPVCYIGTGVDVTYENGAVVPTSFVTNLDPMRLRTAPKLHATVKAANAKALRERRTVAELPKYTYPDAVITAAAMQKLSRYGAELNIGRDAAFYAGALDAQKAVGKAIFGGGFLLTREAAAERAAAERAAAAQAAAEQASAKVWELSERERGLLDEMAKRRA